MSIPPAMITMVAPIAMIAIHHAQAQGIRAMTRSRNLTLGTMLAWEKMNEILINLPNDAPRPGDERKGEFDKPLDQFRWILRVEENTNLPDMIRQQLPLLHLTVLWDTEKDRGGTRRATGGVQEGGKKVEIWTCVANLQ